MDRRNFLQIFSGSALATVCGSGATLNAANFQFGMPTNIGAQAATSAFGIQPLMGGAPTGLCFNMGLAQRGSDANLEREAMLNTSINNMEIYHQPVEANRDGIIDWRVWKAVNGLFDQGRGNGTDGGLTVTYHGKPHISAIIKGESGAIYRRNRLGVANQIIGRRETLDNLFPEFKFKNHIGSDRNANASKMDAKPVSTISPHGTRLEKVIIHDQTPEDSFPSDVIFLNYKGDEYFQTGATIAPVVEDTERQEAPEFTEVEGLTEQVDAETNQQTVTFHAPPAVGGETYNVQDQRQTGDDVPDQLAAKRTKHIAFFTDLGDFTPERYAFTVFPSFFQHITRIKISS